jgi:predicted phage tail protein
MLTQVVLSGPLGKKFGRNWELDVSGPAEALRLINANVPGFRQWIADNAKKYHEYQVTVEYEDGRKADLSEQELDTHCRATTIRFTPLVRGAKAAARVVVGAILMAVSIFVPGPWSPYLFKIGASLAISGVVELLSPRPKTKNQDGTELSSYYFDGPVNTELQGNPVPLIYGRVMTGSQAVSASISIDELSVATVQPATPATGVWIGESNGYSTQNYYDPP